MKYKIGDIYFLDGACQYGTTRDGERITIQPNEKIEKIRDNFADILKIRNMWRILESGIEVDIAQSIIERYYRKSK